jgi:Raf kinase inhibitor-like YbhB/YbcL family protein
VSAWRVADNGTIFASSCVRMHFIWVVFVVLVIGFTSGAYAEAPAEQPSTKAGPTEHAANVDITSHILQPKQLPAADLSSLKVPAGFRVTRFAENLGNVRVLVVANDGTVYATRRDEGDILMLKDPGVAGGMAKPVRVASRSGIHGMALHKGKVYIATVHEIFRADVQPDGHFGALEMLIHDLPDGGQHNTRTVQIGPDEMMYISVGSTCNECAEANPEAATILRASLDGKTRAVFASGLRDTIGWAWHPDTGELWGMDHGIDWWGDETPPEELNHIEKGKRYGWPYFFADNKMNPRLIPPGGLLRSEWRAKSVPMVLGYTPHSAPMQLSFYSGSQFPTEYRGDAFISFHGSWNRKPSSGYEVVRLRFKGGQPTAFEPFLTGFLTPQGETGRPFGNAVAKDGSLLIGDDRAGVIYRISYAGSDASQKGASARSFPPPKAMVAQGGKAADVPLALLRPQTKCSKRLTVQSMAFKNGSAIPAIFSAYEQDNSFPVSWSTGPAGTQSYVLIVEDPDSKKPPKPVLHWVAWNIPAKTTELREGISKQDRLEDPPAMRQGPNTSGQVGYRGPRPPEGDAPHHYHVQIFAIDRTLNLSPGTERDEVLSAIDGHVLASGELVGTFQRPDRPSKP